MADKKVALITGSNKGIGLSVVRLLCKKFDGDVILCSRDEERGTAAVAKLESEGLKPKLRILDVTDNASLTAARDFLLQEYGGLDVLVNNAAVAYIDQSVKPLIEVAKEVLGVNYFATASACDILFPILKPGARVVNVGSSAGMLMGIRSEEKRERLSSPTLTRKDIDHMAQDFFRDVENGKIEENGWPVSSYNTYLVSKVFLAALTWVQHREFQNDQRADLVINVVHPGYVDTDMTAHTGVLTPDEGAEQIVNCCLLTAGSPGGRMIWWDGRVVDWEHDVFPMTDGPRVSENALPD